MYATDVALYGNCRGTAIAELRGIGVEPPGAPKPRISRRRLPTGLAAGGIPGGSEYSRRPYE
jgi:hypothetical protein